MQVTDCSLNHCSLADTGDVEQAMRELLADHRDGLPLPGRGQTLARWQALASVAARNLSLAKIFESHADALAILAELGGKAVGGIHAVWAAETPDAVLAFDGTSATGRKDWCSGAAMVDHGLLTAVDSRDRAVLVQIAMRHPRVRIQPSSWANSGMAAAGTTSILLDHVPARQIGPPEAYANRPGFWQGGAGIAAVWFGAACAVAEPLTISGRIHRDPHAAAHLGAVDACLQSARAALTATANWIDEFPEADACVSALRVRATVEAAACEVIDRVGRALGPGPLCGNSAHAQRCADLAVFLRQSHAERDLEILGRAVDGTSFLLW